MASNPLGKYAADPFAFAADLHVPLGAASGRLGDNWADFQQVDFESLSPALLAVARGTVPPLRRFWIERTKGGSKDSDVAVAILWLLAFAPRSVRCQVGAYDREQASELRYIIRAILDIDAPLNRMLAQVVQVLKDRIVAHASIPSRAESVCEILTTDAFGSHGARPDVVIANELTHVGSEAFMQTLMDNADKVPHSIVIVATNSGERGTWQEKWRDIARDSTRWHVSVLDKPAPWISEDDLEESRKRNPQYRFDRLWKGVWSTGGGNGLDLADIEACTALAEAPAHDPENFYFGGLDLGLKKDRSAFVVLAANVKRRAVDLVAVRSWKPSDFGGEVDLLTIQTTVATLSYAYGLGWVGYDPWQAALLAQNLLRSGVNMQEVPFVPRQKDLMARALLEGFRNRLIRLFPHEEFKRDLLRLRIGEGPIGFRLDAVRDEHGHADTAIAFSMALPVALYAAAEWEIGQFDYPSRIIA